MRGSLLCAALLACIALSCVTPRSREAPRAAARTVPDRWRGTEAGGAAGTGAGTYRLRVLFDATVWSISSSPPSWR